MKEPPNSAPDLAPGGTLHKLADRLGLAHPGISRSVAKIALLILVTCGPLVLLSWKSGYAWGDNVHVTLVRDPDVYGRFLFALPILEIGSLVVAGSIRVQMKHLLESGVILDSERTRFEAAQAEVVRLRDTPVAELIVLLLAFAVPIFLRLVLQLVGGGSSWDCVGSKLTPAGWWYNLVSIPLLYVFLLRRVWVFFLWAWFLVRISRLDLQLTPTHPDRAGGLGFVGQGLVSFAFFVMAVSAIVSAGLADEILNRGHTLGDLKYHVAIFMAILLIVLHSPLLAFSVRLTRCRANGLLEFGALAWRHDREFDEKWFHPAPDKKTESLLGSADIQSLAGLAQCYEHVDRMWLIPIDPKAFAVLVGAAIIPLLPLVGTQIPLQEIFVKLGELLI